MERYKHLVSLLSSLTYTHTFRVRYFANAVTILCSVSVINWSNQLMKRKATEAISWLSSEDDDFELRAVEERQTAHTRKNVNWFR